MGSYPVSPCRPHSFIESFTHDPLLDFSHELGNTTNIHAPVFVEDLPSLKCVKSLKVLSELRVSGLAGAAGWKTPHLVVKKLGFKTQLFNKYMSTSDINVNGRCNLYVSCSGMLSKWWLTLLKIASNLPFGAAFCTTDTTSVIESNQGKNIEEIVSAGNMCTSSLPLFPNQFSLKSIYTA